MELNIVSWNARRVYSVVRKAESNAFTVVTTALRDIKPRPKLPSEVALISDEQWDALLRQCREPTQKSYQVISDLKEEDQLALQNDIRFLWSRFPAACPAAMFACVVAALFNGSLAAIHEDARKTIVFREIYRRCVAVLEPYVDAWEQSKIDSMRRSAPVEEIEAETETDGD